ncbi:unnamed protein product, partial [Polarella glacialis]
LDTTGMDSSHLPAAPPQSAVMLTLSWADGSPQLASDADAMSPTSGLTRALRGAVSSAGLDVLRVDVGIAAGVSGSSTSRGTVCWLSAADAPAAEAELRRQLFDPQSALRKMLPGLVPEDSSATVWHAPVAAVIAQHRALASRVDDLERSRELLADSLGSVERRVLHVEGLAAGAIGVELSAAGGAGYAALGDLSDLQEDVGIGIRSGSAGGRRPAGRAPIAVPHTDGSDESEAGGSSRDLDFGQSFDAPSPSPGPSRGLSREQAAAAAAAVEEAERQRKQAAAASAAAEQAERQQQAEAAGAGVAAAEEEEKQGKQAAAAAEEAAKQRQAEAAAAAAEEEKQIKQAAAEEEEGQRKQAAEEAENQKKQAAAAVAAAAVAEEEAERQREQAAEEEEQRQQESAGRQEEELREQAAAAKAAAAGQRQEEEARGQAEAAAEARREKERLEAERVAQEAAKEEGAVRAEAAWGLFTESLLEREESSQAEAIMAEVEKVAEEKKLRQAVERKRRQAEAAAKEAAEAAATSAAQEEEAASSGERPRRERVKGLPLVARASKRSKDEEIRKAFDAMDSAGRGALSLEDLKSYLCDHLGFGQAEADSFHKKYGAAGADGCVSFEQFKQGYDSLNPYLLMKRQGEVIVRKPGSLGGQQLNLDGLEDCEVYACDTTAQVFADYCKRCVVLIGPCESSVFVRDCEDCVFWMAVQQLRTNNCRRCTFFLYSKTEPIIETSEDLAFAPWTASYPGCRAQFEQTRFDPERNLWNGVFDFTGKIGQSHWRILQADEVSELVLELDDPPPQVPPDNPIRPVTHEMLCAFPLSSGESCGEGIANIPQTRPNAPAAPAAGFSEVSKLIVQDLAVVSREVGAGPLLSRLRAAQAPVSPTAAAAASSTPEAVSAPVSPTAAAAASSTPEAVPAQAPVSPTAAAAATSTPEAVSVESDVESVASAGSPEKAPPVVTVQGGMGGSDSEDSSEGGTPSPARPKGGVAASPAPTPAPAAPDMTPAIPFSPARSLVSSVASPAGAAATASPKQVRQMFGEDSSEEEETIVKEEALAPLASLVTQPKALGQLAPLVSQPKGAGAMPWQRPAAEVVSDISEDDDDEEIERAVAGLAATSSAPSRGAMPTEPVTAYPTEPVTAYPTEPVTASAMKPSVGLGGIAAALMEEWGEEAGMDTGSSRSVSPAAAPKSGPASWIVGELGSALGAAKNPSLQPISPAAASKSGPASWIVGELGSALGAAKKPSPVLANDSGSWDESSMGSPSPTAKVALGLDSPASSVASPAAAKPPLAAVPKRATSPAGSSAAGSQKSRRKSVSSAVDDDYDNDDQFSEDDDISLP